MSGNANELALSRLLSASRAQIWRAWSDPVLLAQWWCPKPWTTEVRAFDLRPGGAFHTFMRGPDGGESDNPGCFLEIVPEQRLVMTNMLGPDYVPQVPWLTMTAIFTMVDEAGGTRYTARALHKDAEESRRHAELGFNEGWGICMDQLDALARTL